MKMLLFTLWFLALSSTFLAQGETIDRPIYGSALRSSYAKTQAENRRVVQNVKSVVNGTERTEEWTYEFQLPDRVRFLRVERWNGTVSRKEQINIGKVRYCRKDDAEWAITESYCIPGSGSGGPSNIVREEFRRTKEKSKDTVTYFQRIVYVNKFSDTVATDGESYWETTFTLDNLGRLLSMEIRKGLVVKKSMPDYVNRETYEYGSKISIEAPIK